MTKTEEVKEGESMLVKVRYMPSLGENCIAVTFAGKSVAIKPDGAKKLIGAVETALKKWQADQFEDDVGVT